MTTSGSTNKVAVAACPFCGGTDTACGIADEEFGRFWVECICGARGPTVETLKDARPAWNKRLAPEPAAQYRFPRNPDPKSGWTIDPEFIHNLDNSIKARPDPWDVGMEGVEEVLLALERLSEAKVTERSARRDVETGREMAGSGNGQPPTKAEK